MRVTVSRSMKDTQFITREEAATGIISRISRNPMTRFLSAGVLSGAGYVRRFRSDISREIRPHSSLRETAAIAPAAA